MRAAASLLLLAFILPAQAEEKVLNLYSWSSYIPEQALERFKEETGIRVKYDIFDSAEALDSKLMTGHSGYDVVFPASSGLARAIQAKALQPIDRSQLSNLGNLDAELLAKLASADPGNQYGLPYTWGTVGLGYNHEAVAQRLPGVATNSLDLLFKPEYAGKLKDCGIAVIDSPQEVIAIALHYLGKDPYSSARDDLVAAQQLLAALQPNLRYVGSGRHIDDLAKGEICLALTYNGDAFMAADNAREAGQPFAVHYRIPPRGLADLVRHHGHPRRCTAPQGRPCLHRPHAAARGHRRTDQQRVLRQRQQRRQ